MSETMITMIVTAVLTALGAFGGIWVKVKLVLKALTESGDVLLKVDRGLKLLEEITEDRLVDKDEVEAVKQFLKSAKKELKEAQDAWKAIGK